MGTLVLAAAKTSSSSGSSSSLLLIVVVFAVLMFFMFRSSRRRQQRQQETQRQIADGSRIRTTFGVYGTIVDSDDKNVMVEIAPGVQMKMLRQAVMAVVPDDEPDGVRQTVPDWDGDDESKPDDDSTDIHG